MHVVGLAFIVFFLCVSLVRLVTDTPGRMARMTRDQLRVAHDPVTGLVESLGTQPRSAYADSAAGH